jgi:hypothetical protein
MLFSARGDSLLRQLVSEYTPFPADSIPVYQFRGDSITVRLRVQKEELCGATDTAFPSALRVMVRHNARILYDAIPKMGRVTCGPAYLTGSDTIRIIAGECCSRAFILADSVPSEIISGGWLSTNKVLLTTSGWTVNTKEYVPESAVTVSFPGNEQIFYLHSTDTTSIDYDIYLVNDSLHDTCYWKNPSPRWHRNDSTYSYLKFFGDDWFMTEETPDNDIRRSRYIDDIIVAIGLSNGTYSIFVKYADGPWDSTLVTPSITVLLSYTSYMGIHALPPVVHQYRARQPIKKDEFWFAGILRIPAMAFDAQGIDSVLSRE